MNLNNAFRRCALACAVYVGVVLPLTAPAGGQGSAEGPDYVLLNGRVFTASSVRVFVEALAIKGERILSTGSSAEISALASPHTIRIDLNGRVVIPGLNDAHYHFMPSPDAHEIRFDEQDPLWPSVKKAIADAVATTPKGTWITGTTGVAVLEDADASRSTLDKLAPEHPVRLATWTGHSSIFNSAFMRTIGIADREPDPPGGFFTRGTDGKLTGRALEYANFLLFAKLQQMTSPESAQKQATQFLHDALRFGITSVQTMAIGCRDETAALLRRTTSPIRIRIINFLLDGPRTPVAAPQLRSAGNVTVGGLKWILDGTPIERSCALRAPYADANTSGIEDFSEPDMEAMLREALRSDEPLLVHAVGDRAVQDFLTAMAATGGSAVWFKRRVRIEHGEGIMSDLIPQVKAMGILVVQNPTHFTLGELFRKRYGAERAADSQPVQSLVRAGIPLALGSDGPMNPYLNVMFAIANPNRPRESLTREQAITAYTRTAAYAEFAENDKGSLEPGKLADLAVLSQDVFQIPAAELPRTESLLTIVGGKIVYDRLTK